MQPAAARAKGKYIHEFVQRVLKLTYCTGKRVHRRTDVSPQPVPPSRSPSEEQMDVASEKANSPEIGVQGQGESGNDDLFLPDVVDDDQDEEQEASAMVSWLLVSRVCSHIYQGPILHSGGRPPNACSPGLGERHGAVFKLQ